MKMGKSKKALSLQQSLQVCGATVDTESEKCMICLLGFP